MNKQRCEWCTGDPLYTAYHDLEWGVPAHDDRRLFEMLILEGAQAGLSWLTILRRREHYREAFHGFDADRIARYGARDLARLLSDPGIVRNRLKIEAAVANARAYLKIVEDFGSFDRFLWAYAGNRPIQNAWRSASEIPSHTTDSDRMSKDLKARGFKFVGSTICYAMMQAVGMVNDHVVPCFRYREVKQIARGEAR
jgi:DNA-3-methyladenine glycosylase I